VSGIKSKYPRSDSSGDAVWYQLWSATL